MRAGVTGFCSGTSSAMRRHEVDAVGESAQPPTKFDESIHDSGVRSAARELLRVQSSPDARTGSVYWVKDVDRELHTEASRSPDGRERGPQSSQQGYSRRLWLVYPVVLVPFDDGLSLTEPAPDSGALGVMVRVAFGDWMVRQPAAATAWRTAVGLETHAVWESPSVPPQGRWRSAVGRWSSDDELEGLRRPPLRARNSPASIGTGWSGTQLNTYCDDPFRRSPTVGRKKESARDRFTIIGYVGDSLTVPAVQRGVRLRSSNCTGPRAILPKSTAFVGTRSDRHRR